MEDTYLLVQVVLGDFR